MTSLKILYHHRIRSDDGQAVHVRELITALRGLGHEVRECALVPKAGQQREASKGGLWRFLRLPRVLLEVLEVWYGKTGNRRLVRVARDFFPDVIYERHALHCRVGLNAAKALKVPLLLEVNSPMCEEMAAQGQLVFPRMARRTERAVLGSADRVFTVSDDLRERLMAAGAVPERCLVIRNAAVPERYENLGDVRQAIRTQLHVREDVLLMGFIGFMRPWHRLDMALQALADERLGNMHLVLLGDGPALQSLRERARSLGVANRLHVRAPMPQDELSRWVASFDIGLVAAINPYASPLKLFDYLVAGVAVLAPRQPNIEEMLTDGVDARLFEPGDLQSLISCLVAMGEDRSQTRQLGVAGAALLARERWTWQANAERVIEAYRGIRA